MIETRSDLLSVMKTSIGDGVDMESYFSEIMEEEHRLNGGHYGQVGKGFHAKPFVKIDEIPTESKLGFEPKRERRMRLFVGSIADTSLEKTLFSCGKLKMKVEKFVSLITKPPIFISSMEEARQLPDNQLKILKTSTGAVVCF